jgi:hypothetical protein
MKIILEKNMKKFVFLEFAEDSEFDYDTIFKRYKGKQDIDKRIKQSKLNQKIETINKYNATYQEFIKVSP